jgi:hypothetical protein
MYPHYPKGGIMEIREQIIRRGESTKPRSNKKTQQSTSGKQVIIKALPTLITIATLDCAYNSEAPIKL